MLPEQWQEIEKLYHSAIERSPEDRQSYLESACAGNEALQREVESLLASDDLAAAFLETKEPNVNTEAAEEPIPAGTQIGPYKILEFLRAGGMGAVYKGRDTRLNRIVAVKFLPATIAGDPAASERFQREARAASALNHRRICTVYDVGEYESRPFIVMEFLEGGSLRDRIAGKPVPIPDLLNTGIQVCEGLQAAHAKGIVHRDVKPANISVGTTGEIKILDFGVAKVGWEHGAQKSTLAAESECTATKTLIQLTRPGTLTGTLAYLSPEQARGEEVDSRTDIFSLGAVMYEMATGRQPFHGETAAELLTAILTEHPRRPSESNAAVSRRLETIISKALAKERAARYQSAEELAGDLRPLTVSRRYRSVITASVLGLLAGVVLLVWIATRPAAGPKLETFIQLTDRPGEELYPSLAPDGNSFVYQSRASGKWGIYFKRIGGQNSVSLTKDLGYDDTQPAISPDGEHVAFRSEREGGGIFVMGLTGENVRGLTKFGYNPAWSPDGKEIVYSTGSFIRPEERYSLGAKLFRVNVGTGETRAIAGIDDGLQPTWSPHGYRIAYWNSPKGSRNIWTIASMGGNPVPVTDDLAVDWSPVWSPDGRYLYFSSDRGGSMNLWRVRIDEASGKPLMAPEPFTTPAPSSGFMSFSRDGLHMAYAAQARDLNLYKLRFDPFRESSSGEPVPVTQGSKPLADPDFSPDGQWIIFNSRLTPQNLFVVRSDGTGLRQITHGEQMDRCSRWSPDGKQIAFFSNRTGRWQAYTIQPDGSGLERRTDEAAGALFVKWSSDGKRLLYITNGRVAVMDAAKPWKDQEIQMLPDPGSGARFAADAWSPDGRMLAGELQDGSTPLGLAIYRLDSQTFERIGPAGLGPEARWLPDSRRLLFLHDGNIHLVEIGSNRGSLVFSAGPRRDIVTFGVSGDGRLIAFTVEAAEADIWLANLK
jgi:serine/threonine protein kinase/Tol biopolymer transport system component